ncbi:Por secretion system C-terminal sorting domain-containing protein [Flavobacterium fluvii]|uniref:Por secretion system C-terminal sorting domain-containing protein n=1 Tax=Flavobacterium fluvii TaxID=468056 RepID=A0A1M5G0R6_9FLAO|nr:T9SS type A sorting domain-containing protein [Flavobacterium fluvii]SHF97318.1 Por secretion system C-terminal sorting domain-containing protein [Flavobacterium fluvii]
MKKILLFILFPFFCFGQTQIGADIDGEAGNLYSGSSVSLSGDGSIVAIGATQQWTFGENSASVRVYKNVSGTWTQVGADIDGEAADDGNGWSVSLSSDGTTLAIGAPGNDGNGSFSGSVRVYKNVSGTWTQVGGDIDGEAAGDWSGSSVSLSNDGSILAIGALTNSGNGTYSGSVRVYKNVSNTWTQVGTDIDGEAAGDWTGNSVSLSGDGSILAIGAPQNDGNGAESGSVRVYKNVSGTWTQVGGDIDGEAAGDSFGSSVSLSTDATTLAIGAIANDGNGFNSGSVRVYKNVSGTWTQVGTDIDGEAAGDQSGSVSLSGNGSILAIGATNNGGNGNGSGSVRVYKNVSGTWTKVGTDIDGEAAGDESGSVSLSGDGSILAIGAPGNYGFTGSVRVYDLSAVLSSDSFVLANFSVYPNPASGTVTISFQEDLILEKVNVYNTLGQLVKTEKSTSISMSSLTNGSYFFEVITNEGKATKTIIKK